MTNGISVKVSMFQTDNEQWSKIGQKQLDNVCSELKTKAKTRVELIHTTKPEISQQGEEYPSYKTPFSCNTNFDVYVFNGEHFIDYNSGSLSNCLVNESAVTAFLSQLNSHCNFAHPNQKSQCLHEKAQCYEYKTADTRHEVHQPHLKNDYSVRPLDASSNRAKGFLGTLKSWLN
ncbi:hypothetical protein SOPP22_03120 [Shewanella sp. OPT22]|nr:hypothetical protein SOPP22_03120 [Shewanella sp. OPT22]